MNTKPLAGCVSIPTMLMLSPSGSVSLAKTGIVTGVLSGVVAKSLLATGGWFMGAPSTKMMTNASSVSEPSEIT